MELKKQYAITIRRLKFHKSGMKTKLPLSQSKSTTLPRTFGNINIQFGQQNCRIREQKEMGKIEYKDKNELLQSYYSTIVVIQCRLAEKSITYTELLQLQ